jgi:hypothetical protein
VDKGGFSADAAQILALQALAWVVAQPEMLSDFLSSTGAYGQDLAQLARQPLFLGAVLDYLLEQDQRVVEFCTAHGAALTHPQMARLALPGAQHLHWT